MDAVHFHSISVPFSDGFWMFIAVFLLHPPISS
ncbi:putative membrane protein [Candidatus Protofrankia californiensis]|uniref:Putative membrane protein n=1 Tax=Candidatus Protofrankia californiensis TaxID=1839754 RepID=A0A1C3NX99_9ACTN|nr:putative membrane protein [Candidatus Protofrankia californiensis]